MIVKVLFSMLIFVVTILFVKSIMPISMNNENMLVAGFFTLAGISISNVLFYHGGRK